MGYLSAMQAKDHYFDLIRPFIAKIGCTIFQPFKNSAIFFLPSNFWLTVVQLYLFSLEGSIELEKNAAL